MPNWDSLNREMLPRIQKRLSEIRSMPQADRFDALTDLLANVSLSPDEKLKLRGKLFSEFGYSLKDFNEAFGCRFSLVLYEKVGRGR